MFNEIVMGGFVALVIVLVVNAIATHQSLSVLKRRIRALEQGLSAEESSRYDKDSRIEGEFARELGKLDDVVSQVIAYLGLRLDKVVNPNEVANTPAGRMVRVQHALKGEYTPMNPSLFPGRERISAHERLIDTLFTRITSMEQQSITSLRNQVDSLANVVGAEAEWMPLNKHALGQAWPYRYILKRAAKGPAMKKPTVKRPRKPKK